MMGQLSLEQMEMEQLRQQVADLSARLDTAQVMILERDAIIAGQAGRLAERDACIAAAEDMATQAVQAAVTARAQVAERDAKIAELEADLDAISKAFRLHTRPPTTGT